MTSLAAISSEKSFFYMIFVSFCSFICAAELISIEWSEEVLDDFIHVPLGKKGAGWERRDTCLFVDVLFSIN